MLRKSLMIFSLCVMFFSTGINANVFSTQSATWKRYIAPTERKAILEKASRGTGIIAKFRGGISAKVLWVTDEVVRVLVSDMLDKGQLNVKEADWEYFDLRPEKHYMFYLFIKVGSKKPWDPLDKKAFTLYKEHDAANRITDAEVYDATFKPRLKEALATAFEVDKGNQYAALVPRKNASGKPVIGDLNDEASAMFSLQGKEVMLKFSIKELVKELKEL
ncbi:MAG: hypothetical protein AB1757_00620 [Acidobacteriota bacterium]